MRGPAGTTAPPVFLQAAHGRRCRRDHHGTDRTTHVLPWTERRRPGPIRDPKPLIANELEVPFSEGGLVHGI